METSNATPPLGGQPMTLDDLSKFLGISRRKIQYDVAAKLLAHVRLGRRILFLPSDVEAYLRKHRINSCNPEETKT